MRTKLSILYVKPSISRLLNYLKQKEGVRLGGELITKQSLTEQAIWDLTASMCQEHNWEIPEELWDRG